MMARETWCIWMWCDKSEMAF